LEIRKILGVYTREKGDGYNYYNKKIIFHKVHDNNAFYNLTAFCYE
jgi:hypothetical protein